MIRICILMLRLIFIHISILTHTRTRILHTGSQPNGKQRISAIDNPGGDTYTPRSYAYISLLILHISILRILLIRILHTFVRVLH